MNTLTARPGAAISRNMDPEQTVELFCGEEKPFSSFASALGFKTFTVDSNPAFRPDLVGIERDFDVSKLPAGPLIRPAFFGHSVCHPCAKDSSVGNGISGKIRNP